MGKSSLKQVLKSFLDHFEHMESSHECEESDLYLDEFHSLKDLTETLKRDPEFTCSEGLKDVNRRKNRYKDILPYDRSRVVISEYPGVPGSDYINANYVKGSTGSSCAYIASQGPLPNTLVDFWRMIWECETTVIVMACNESESGKYKCESYWPETSDQEQQYGNISVKLVKWKQVCPDFLVRTLEIRQDKTERTVIQFHYSTWPDHGVPVAVTPILELVRLMRDVQATEARPIIVHCSAGCGRTGTICSIDYVWGLLRAGKLSEDFSLYSIIREMRKQRIAMVQTLEQYMLCYKAVAALFEQQLKIIDAHTYENLDEDGEPLILKSISFTDDSSSEEAAPSQPFPPPELPLIVPTEDPPSVETLIKDWKEKINFDEDERVDFRGRNFEMPKRAPSLDSLISPPLMSPPSSAIYGTEKLVGRATVIRRPSIAQLKAMFENMQSNEDNERRERSERPDRRNRKLQRSQSTKERSSRIFSVNRSFDANMMSISHEAAAVAARAFCIRDSSPETHQNPTSSSNPSSCNMSSLHTTNSSEDGLRSDGIEDDEVESEYPQRQTNSAISMQSSADTGYSAASGPPKPPRTYEYLTGRPVEKQEGGGRIIVTVAQPKQPNEANYGNIVPNNHYAAFQQQQQNQMQQQQLQLQRIRDRAKHLSTPNLANFSNFNGHPFNGFNPGNNPFLIHRPTPQVHQYQPYELRSQQEPIYQTLVPRNYNQHQQAANQLHLQQQMRLQQQQQFLYQQMEQQRIYGQIGFQRMLPPIPNQQQPPQLLPKLLPSNRVAATPSVGAMMMNNGEDIYEVPNKRPILANEQTRQNRLPVTYVRPLPNPKLNMESNGDSNSSQPASQKDVVSLKLKSQSSKNISRDEEKKKSHFSFNVASIFSRKKKSLKSSSGHSSSAHNLSSAHISLPNVTSGIIRPPHSHRFSPPAQWTQV